MYIVNDLRAITVQSAHVTMVTAAFDLLAYSTNIENLVATNLHNTNFA
jgi:hypothetical protein